MRVSVTRFLLTAVLTASSAVIPLCGQAQGSSTAVAGPKHLFELLITSSARPDGTAEVQLTSAGLNGVEIHQLRSESDQRVVSKTVLGQVASASATNLSHTRLVLEKEPGADRVVLLLFPMATPGKSIRLILPTEPTARTGAVTMGIINYPINDEPGGSGGSGCYPISWTSDRCGTITKCCPTTSVSIDGVNCTITCN